MKYRTHPIGSSLRAGVMLFVVVPLSWTLVGCDDAEDVREVPEVRQARKARARVLGPLTETERFQPPRDPSAPSMGNPEVLFELQDGWVELTPTTTRQINISIASRPEVECYLAILPGRAGGGLANVNRWRGQMGLEPIDEAQFAALPTASLLGKPGVFVDLEGSFTGMGGPVQDGWRMAGMIAESGGMTAFLKMTGPTDDVGAELESLHAFARSIRIEDRGASGGGGPADDATGGLVFATPEGWERGPARSARLMTFYPGGDEEIECYVTMLGGDGGGLLANLNRWRSQLGAEAMTEEEIADLPTVKLFGKACPVLLVEGAFTGMALPMSDDPVEATPDQALLGTVRLVPQGAIFVKMVGPRDRVLAERQHFMDFCESLGF